MTTPPSAPPRLVVLDDVWEPPPTPSRRPLVLAVSAGAVLALTLAIVTISSGLREPEAAWVASAPAGHGLWYPSDSTPSRPPAPAPVPTPVPVRVRVPVQRERAPRPRAVIAPRPSAPSEPRAARAGYLSINSMPWAVVSVDGRVLGNTPQRAISMSAGRHQIVLVRDGFETHRAWIAVQPGDTLRITDIVLQRIGS